MNYPSEPAEDTFEAWAAANKIVVIRYGLSRPDFKYTNQLPAPILVTPDFLVETQGERFHHLPNARGRPSRHALVECKGVGRDQLIKIKLDTLKELRNWQERTTLPIAFFIYDSHKHRITPLLPLAHISDLAQAAERGVYHESRKEFCKIPTKAIEHWEYVAK